MPRVSSSHESPTGRRGADLAQTDLAQTDLAQTDLAGADLPAADLARTDLPAADLAGAADEAPADGARTPAASPDGGPRRGKKGGLRAAQRAFTHARFIDAAVVEFGERGYARTTVDDIVARAGATRATFYLHFRGKVDILRELYDHMMTVFEGIYDELEAVGRNPTLAGLEAWLRMDVERWEPIRQYAAPLSDGAAIEPEIRKLVDQGYGHQIHYLATTLLAAREDLGPDDAELTATVLLMPLMHFFDRYVHGQLADSERMIAVLAAAWLAIITKAGA